jgi:pyruvate/2-oxoglutarate dehydrogenase complex dihydrolipoamide acyltransferase (E2) component
VIEVSLPADAWNDVETGVEALVDQWHVAEGDTVSAGQLLAKVVLVKANLDMMAPTSGRIVKIMINAGETFARGKPIALIREAA